MLCYCFIIIFAQKFEKIEKKFDWKSILKNYLKKYFSKSSKTWMTLSLMHKLFFHPKISWSVPEFPPLLSLPWVNFLQTMKREWGLHLVAPVFSWVGLQRGEKYMYNGDIINLKKKICVFFWLIAINFDIINIKAVMIIESLYIHVTLWWWILLYLKMYHWKAFIEAVMILFCVTKEYL